MVHESKLHCPSDHTSPDLPLVTTKNNWSPNIYEVKIINFYVDTQSSTWCV